MFQSPRFSLVLTAAVFASPICGFVGCNSGPLAGVDWRDPFQTVDISYKKDYGLTPEQVAQRIRELGSKAASMSPEEQQKAAAELTTRYEHEGDALLRREMIRSLGSLPDPYATAGLRAAMSDADRFVRVEACRAWGRRSSDEARQLLTTAIHADESVDVRQVAIQNFKNFQHPDAIRTLGSLLDERDPALQMLAMQSLRGASGKDLGNDVRQWKEYVASNYPSRQANPTDPSAGDTMIAEPPTSDTWR